MSALRGLLDVRPGERRNTFAAFATLFAVTGGHTLLETSRDALFLSKLPASRLPWMYLAIVFAALLLGQVGRGGARTGSRGAVAVALAFAAVVTTGFWALLAAPSQTLLYALYVWTGLFASWVTVQFWTLLGRVHTVTQAKRLYGLIGGGAVLGAVVGAFGARAALGVLAPRTTVLLAAVVFAAAIVPCLFVVVPQAAAPLLVASGAGVKRPMSAGVALLWDNAFARRVLGIVLVSTVTVTLADYLFKSTLAARVTDPRELGEVLSSFYAVTNTLALIMQLLVAPWVFRALGVQRALFVFPSLLFAAAANLMLSGAGFVAALALKGLDGTFRYSIHRTTTELLLVPVPDGTRERIKPVIDLLGSRGGQALASVFVLLLVAVGAADPRTLGAVVLTLTVVWLATVFTIRKLYLDVFRETLRTGGLSGKAELPELDLGALETLFAGLSSSRDTEVLASLELLAEQHRERLVPALILYHPAREVVLRSLEIFTQMGRTDFVPIADRLADHPDGEVAASALRARISVMPDERLLRARLASRSREVAITALVALLVRGWMSTEEADELVAEALASGDAKVLAELARALRAASVEIDGRAIAAFADDLLVRLATTARELRDRPANDRAADPADRAALPLLPPPPPDVRVLVEVARAMGSRRSAPFVPYLVAMLDRHELRAEARQALLRLPGALEALDLAMSAPQLPRDVRVHLPRTIGAFAPRDAAPVLLRHLVHERDGAVRFKSLRALVKLRRLEPGLPLDAAPLTSVVDATMEHVQELARWSAALAGGTGEGGDQAPPSDPLRAAHHLLVDLLHDKEVHATERLFLLLGLLLEEDFGDVWRGLRSSEPKRRASGLELLDNLVPQPLRQRVLAIVGEGRGRSAPPPYEVALREMLARGGGTIRTLAEVRAGQLGLEGLVRGASADADGRGSASDDLAATLRARVSSIARELAPAVAGTSPLAGPFPVGGGGG